MAKGNRRLLAQQFFDRLHQAGFSANQALQFLRKQGLGYRRQQFLRDWNRHFQYVSRKERVKYTPKKFVIPESYFEPTEKNYERKYVYMVKVKGFDRLTGAEREQYITVESDYRAAKSTVIKSALNLIRMRRQNYPIDVQEADIADLYKKL